MSKHIGVGLLALLLIGLLAIGAVLALSPNLPVLAQAAATPTATAGTNMGSPTPGAGGAGNSDVEIWDQFCVAKVPYAVLAMPQGASLNIVKDTRPTPVPKAGYVNADQIACTSVGIFRDKQVVVCRGPQSYTLSLQLSGADAPQTFDVPFRECGFPNSTKPSGQP